MQSFCLEIPRERSLEHIFHIFAYFDNKHNIEIVFDLSILDVNESQF